MKKTIIWILFFIFIFFSCNKKQDLGKNYITNDSISIKTNNIGVKLSNNTNNDKNDSIKKNNLNPEKLIGIWGLTGDENAAFEIYKDFIFYVDAYEKVFYTVKKDTIFIFLEPDYIDTSIYEIKGDKLILKWGDFSDTLERFNK